MNNTKYPLMLIMAFFLPAPATMANTELSIGQLAKVVVNGELLSRTAEDMYSVISGLNTYRNSWH